MNHEILGQCLVKEGIEKSEWMDMRRWGSRIEMLCKKFE